MVSKVLLRLTGSSWKVGTTVLMESITRLEALFSSVCSPSFPNIPVSFGGPNMIYVAQSHRY